MIVNVSYYDQTEKSVFRIPKTTELKISSLKEVEDFIIDNNYKFCYLKVIEGYLKTRPAKTNENLVGKLIKYQSDNHFELATRMIIGKELDKLNSNLNEASTIPMVEFSNKTYERISKVEVVDFNFKLINNKVLNLSIMLDKEYQQLMTESNIVKQTMSFTGHRPDKLGGYSTPQQTYLKNEIMLKLRDVLKEELEYYITKENVQYFITGGALGFDQLVFWVITEMKKKYPHIQNILAIPFEGFESRWQPIDKEWYYKMLKFADKIIYVDKLKDYSVEEENARLRVIIQLQRRNEYMVDNSTYILSAFDGSKGGTQNCINYARKLNRKIKILNPKSNNFQFKEMP